MNCCPKLVRRKNISEHKTQRNGLLHNFLLCLRCRDEKICVTLMGAKAMGQCYLNGWQWWGLHEAWWGVEVESVLLVISLSSLCQNQKVLNWKPLDCISSFWFLIAHCSVLISFDRRTIWYCTKGSSSVEFNDGRFYRDQLHFINCRQKLQSAAGLTFPSLNHFISERISEGVENIENFLRPGKRLICAIHSLQ